MHGHGEEAHYKKLYIVLTQMIFLAAHNQQNFAGLHVMPPLNPSLFSTYESGEIC